MSNCCFTEWQRCCCQCHYHIPDLSHPLTDGNMVSEQRGWICLPPECQGAFSGWSEHGMCEMFEKREKNE